MEIKELRGKSEKELNRLLFTSREKLRDLRFKIFAKQVKNVREVRKIKRLIAQILTVLKESKNKK